jgi:hypothetical protein
MTAEKRLIGVWIPAFAGMTMKGCDLPDSIY